MRSVFENNGFLVSGLFLSPYVNQSRGRTSRKKMINLELATRRVPELLQLGGLIHANAMFCFKFLALHILHCRVTRVSLNDSTRIFKYFIYFSKLGTHVPYGLSYCSPKSRISVVRGPHAVQQLFAVLGTIAAEVSKAKSESLLQTHFNWQCQAWVEQTPGMIKKNVTAAATLKNPMEFSVRAWHCVFLLRCCWLLNDHHKH
jgi:hypothetical protein